MPAEASRTTAEMSALKCDYCTLHLRLLDSRLFFFGAGGRLPIRNGVGGFTIKLIHSFIKWDYKIALPPGARRCYCNGYFFIRAGL